MSLTVAPNTTKVISTIPIEPPYSELTVEQLEKRGIPRQIFEALRDGYREALGVYGRNAISIERYHLNLKDLEEVLPALETLHITLKNGHRKKLGGQWKKISPEESLPRLIEIFHSMIVSTKYSKEHPLVKLSDKIIHLLISFYCKKQDLGPSNFFSIPIVQEEDYKASLVCTKEREYWSAHSRVYEKGKTGHSLLQTSTNRALLLDENFEPIDRPCISATFHPNYLDKKTDQMCFQAEEYAIAPKNVKELSIFLQFTYYTGIPQRDDQPNALVYNAILQANGTYDLVAPKEIANQALLKTGAEFAAAYIDLVKEGIIEQFQEDVTIFPSHLHLIPTSESEWRMMDRQVLEEIAKKPEEHAEVIQLLLDHANLPLIEDAPEEVQVSPKEAIEVLLKAHPPIEEPKANLGIDSSLMQKDAERKWGIEKAAPSTTKKPNSHKKHRGKKKVQQKKPEPEAQAAEPTLKTRIVLSSDERSTVRQVYQGHAMKGHDFNKFVLTLLERKVKNMNIRRSGSHINAARETLVRMHRNGRKDLVGHVSHQKSILREVLSPSKN